MKKGPLDAYCFTHGNFTIISAREFILTLGIDVIFFLKNVSVIKYHFNKIPFFFFLTN